MACFNASKRGVLYTTTQTVVISVIILFFLLFLQKGPSAKWNIPKERLQHQLNSH